jgi:hypothetical protein
VSLSFVLCTQLSIAANFFIIICFDQPKGITIFYGKSALNREQFEMLGACLSLLPQSTFIAMHAGEREIEREKETFSLFNCFLKPFYKLVTARRTQEFHLSPNSSRKS